MTLAYPLLNEALRFSENSVNVLIIESAPELRRFIFGMQYQLDGSSGELVLAEDDTILELCKNALFISNPFSLDLDSRKFVSKIAQDACAVGAEYADDFYALMGQLNSLAANISRALDYDASYNPIDSWDELIKLMGFHVDESELEFPERLLEYIKLHRKFFHKKLFIFYNLKACLSPEELSLFYRNALYEKFDLLLVEDIQREALREYEKTIIVDKDLCIF